MANCKNCAHFKKLYMPSVHAYTYGCELEKHTTGCRDEFVKKYKDTGKPKAFIK